ncbi:MAG: helix-turn-helix transcriptional regulator [Alphaproteobacteria bacterium]|nr:helix-turn-helix transcriptional regulator [Alphaproteobacteria bacterium]MBU2041020.1 helix-turn-helix transcriptional regulator [Alphaproteobacteria bacterium]MBU2127095.1 helix-turn-helix transcriptional regulator [Alphaproteobacteria bacterium]MBU2207801.1 helix-turn-helix transcriptional regulator [Alphaproteobacteria bacterium]MBU2289575.1 helix-turn-helix transcriptional regulator [Alphaproteobacteria bacterium]
MPSRSDRLTERERECLRLVHAHMNSKQIARRLGIKPSTVDRHCENAARKLRASGRVDAALLLLAGQLPDDSVSEPIPIAADPAAGSSGPAKGIIHDRHTGTGARHQLGGTSDRASLAGRYAGEADDGQPSGRGNPQTGGLPLSGSDLQGDPAHRGGPAGYRFPTPGIGHEVLGRVLFVFSIAAVAALVLTSVIGAERFAFVLQGIRYGN